MINWAYIAGFFDGEGTVCLTQNHKYGHSPHVSLCQSGEIGTKVLENIQRFLVGREIVGSRIYLATKTKLSVLPVYRLYIQNRKDAVAFLENTMPYLVTKKLEAQDVLRHLKLFPALPRGGRLAAEGRKQIKEPR